MVILLFDQRWHMAHRNSNKRWLCRWRRRRCALRAASAHVFDAVLPVPTAPRSACHRVATRWLVSGCRGAVVQRNEELQTQAARRSFYDRESTFPAAMYFSYNLVTVSIQPSYSKLNNNVLQLKHFPTHLYLLLPFLLLPSRFLDKCATKGCT